MGLTKCTMSEYYRDDYGTMCDMTKVVCLCGSTRFRDEFAEVNRRETMNGRIVLAPGVFAHAGDPLTDDDKRRLDELHLRKIDMAHIVIVVNPGGYIGDSTRQEIQYALRVGKPVFYTHNPTRYERFTHQPAS